MPANDAQPDTIAAAITEVSDSLTRLVHDEIELVKAEMSLKLQSIARGAAAVAAGAVFGVFALVFGLLSIAWGINSAVNSLWVGMVCVFALLISLAIGAFFFAWRKLRVGPPVPTMAIDEARKIQETVTTTSASGR